jgi:hypothetical protein
MAFKMAAMATVLHGMLGVITNLIEDITPCMIVELTNWMNTRRYQ